MSAVLDSAGPTPKNVCWSQGGRSIKIWLALLGISLLLACSEEHPGGRDASSTDRGSDRAAADLSLDLTRLRPDGGSNLGAACKDDLDCSAGLTCDRSQPAGMCTRPCSGDSDCGSTDGCFGGQCHPACNVRYIPNPCRKGYICRLEQARSACVADCRGPSGCKTGWTCDKTSGLCLNPKGGAVGAACGIGIGDCSGTANGVCYSVSSLQKSFCTVACTPFTKPCPVDIKGAYCAVGKNANELCLFTCDPKKPICPRTDMQCVSVSKNVSLCLPK